MVKDGMMPEKKIKTYTRKGIDRVIKDLVEWAQLTQRQFYPKHFVEKHPWTSRYLGPFAEAVEFKKLVYDETLVVKEDVHEMMDKWRAERGLPLNIRIRVSVREIRTRTDVQTFYFTFEEVKPGIFRCING
jgi:hypothetical protein